MWTPVMPTWSSFQPNIPKCTSYINLRLVDRYTKMYPQNCFRDIGVTGTDLHVSAILTHAEGTDWFASSSSS
jgi:hypothetical protein